MSNALTHVHKGFGTVRPYLHGPIDFPEFLENTFDAVVLERNDEGPTLLQVGDSLIWVEATPSRRALGRIGLRIC